MRLRLEHAGALTVDGASSSWRYDAPSTTLVTELAGERFGIRVFGPFGQGYNLALERDGTPELRLEYHWREGGAWIARWYDAPPYRVELTLSDTRITGRRGAEVGSIALDDEGVDVVLDAATIALEPIGVALLAAVNALYWNGAGVFAKRGG